MNCICTYNYDARGQLSGLAQVTNGYAGPSYTSLARDGAGNLLSEQATWPKVNSPFSRAFTYDTSHGTPSQNRDVLLTETGTPGNGNQFNEEWSDTYGYDAAFNINPYAYCSNPLATIPTDPSESFSYSLDNQLSSGLFAYDSSGNPGTYEGKTLTFDANNKLVGAPLPNRGTFTAQYDGDGHRVAKTVNGTTTYYIYDGDRPIVEETYTSADANGAATLSAVTGYTADGPRSRTSAPNGEWAVDSYAYDPQGSLAVRERWDYYGLTNNVYLRDFTLYEGYGSLRSDTSERPDTEAYPNPNLGQSIPAIDPIGFGGQYGYYTDPESGLVLCTNRYYDPGTGRWLTRDPIGYAGGVTIYGYCGGNPVNESDQSGLFDVKVGGFEFTDDVVISGVAVGTAAIGSSASMGVWNGGKARRDPSFKTSKVFADVGITTALLALPVGSLSAGARTVFYSGGEEALLAARTGKGAGKLLEDTLGARLMSKIEELLGRRLPIGAWKGASAIFALNAKGDIVAFLRNPPVEGIWNTIERPIISTLRRTVVLK